MEDVFWLLYLAASSYYRQRYYLYHSTMILVDTRTIRIQTFSGPAPILTQMISSVSNIVSDVQWTFPLIMRE